MIRIAQFRVLVILFFCTFFYAIFASIISRELIIPNMLPSVEGHISGDPLYYHQLALSKVQEIQDEGIQAFELRAAGQGPAGIASLLYLAWGNQYSVVLLNAVLHATSAVLMSLILLQWFSLRTAIIATLPLVISPYMIVWFSQINKDTSSLTGTLLFVYGLIRLIKIKEEPHAGLHPLLIVFLGILLIWVMRPYLNQILLPISLLIFGFIFCIFFNRAEGNKSDVVAFAMCGTLVLIFLSLMGRGAASDETIASFHHFEVQSQNQVANQSVANECFNSVDSRNWEDAKYLPAYLNAKLRGLMGQRCWIFTVIETDNNLTTQNSFVDTSKLPAGSLDALKYLPRAALLGVFAPWPNYWGEIFNHFSVFYLITPIEAIMLYGGFLGLLYWLLRTRAWSALVPIFIAVSVMTAYGAAIPFIGALYRYRYPMWMLLICMGIAALLTLAKLDEKK